MTTLVYLFLSLFLPIVISQSSTYHNNKYVTYNTINWVESEMKMPTSLRNAIIAFHEGHFIMFGGREITTSKDLWNENIYIGYTSKQATSSPTASTQNMPNSTLYPTSDPTRGPTDIITPSPTQIPTIDYGYKPIIEWKGNHTLKENSDPLWEIQAHKIQCNTQCYSTANLKNDGMLYFIGRTPSCDEDYFLYNLDLYQLIYNDNVRFNRFNLTQYFMNSTSLLTNNCAYNQDDIYKESCVAINGDNWWYEKSVYIIRGNTIFIYNISTKSGYFSNAKFTTFDQGCDYNQKLPDGGYNCSIWDRWPYTLRNPSCLFDKTGKFIWITDQNSNIWRYSIDDDDIIDVTAEIIDIKTMQPKINGTLNKINEYEDDAHVRPFYHRSYETSHSRMVQLSDGYILVVGERRDFILLPNLTLSNNYYSSSKTKYIDVVCAGRDHDIYKDWIGSNIPFNMEWPSNKILSFGGDIYHDSNWIFEEYQNGDTYWNEEFNRSLTDQIRYYDWLNDYNVIINFTEKILFGDNIKLNIYLEPTCDIKPYNGYTWMANNNNPFLIIIKIDAQDVSLEIDKFLYIINATYITDYYDWTTTYEFCYICNVEFNDNNQNWQDSEAILGDTDTGCSLCSDGLSTGSVDENQAGTLYSLQFEIIEIIGSGTFMLDSTDRNFTIAECDPGYGTTPGAQSIDCNECPFNQFTLRSSLDACFPCNSGVEGLLCEGGNSTQLTYNHWIAAWDHSKQELKAFYDIEQYNASHDDDTIVTAVCPPKYCCQSVKGCDYLSEYLKRPQKYTEKSSKCGGHYDENNQFIVNSGYYVNGTFVPCTDNHIYSETRWNYSRDDIRANGILCAFGRDVNVPLCGACLEGWSELLATPQCGDCSEAEGGAASITFLCFILTMFLSWYIIFCDSKPVHYSETLTKKALIIQDDITGFQTILFKPVLYYFQSLNPILDTRGITLWISPVLSFFNFSFDTIGGEDARICWTNGLNACGEILINLLFPTLLMLHIFIPRLCVNTKGYGSCICHCCCKKKKICCCCCKAYQTPYFASAFFRVLLITIGVVLTVCFKYLTYVEIEEEKLMFYSADQNAFGGWWFLGFLGVFAVICSFILIWWKIKKQESDDRYSTHSIYQKFVKSFKMEYWFWEFVLFSRRFFIACFTSIQFVGGDYTNFIFLVILVIYLVFQVHYKPFAYSRVNKIETLCLILLICAFSAANFIEINDNDVFVGWILSICILIPLLIIGFYTLKIIVNRGILCGYDGSVNPKYDDKVDKVLKRMPKSYRDVAGDTLRGDNLEDFHGDTPLETNNNDDNNNDNNNHELQPSIDEHKEIETVNATKAIEMAQIKSDSDTEEVQSAAVPPGYNPKGIQHQEYNNNNDDNNNDNGNDNDNDENIVENELNVVMDQEADHGEGNQMTNI